MDNPTRWNITNSAQNIVSALIDPNKQFDHVFRREWNSTFSSFPRHKLSIKSKQDAELKAKLTYYVNKLEERKHIKILEAQQEDASKKRQDEVVVPEIFFIEHFDLSNLDIFNKVLSSGVIRTNNYSKSSNNYLHNDDAGQQQFISNNSTSSNTFTFTTSQLKQLQEDFTDYLDIIEEKLATQISNRSGDFLKVMSSVDSVMDELSLTIKSVTSLRRKCSILNESLIMPNMKNIKLSKARDNTQLVLDKMKEISELCKVQPILRLLLWTSDFAGASELIAKSRIKMHELSRVACLRHLEAQFVEIERVICLMIHQEFAAQQKFVNKFHEERKKKIESNLDIEQWKMVEDIPEDFQRLISMIVDEGVSISETFSMDNQSTSRASSSSKQHSRAFSDSAVSAATLENVNIPTSYQNNKHKMNNGNTRISCISANGSTYVIVNSVINLIRILMEYCKCAYDTKPLSAELLERLFTILQLYNSKTYHLVYSAGAIQVAGLKTITTRSLVVSQRSLKLIVLLIPAIQTHFSQLLPEESLKRLRRFDEIISSYEDHAAKIPERINSIVKDVINLQLQEWEAKPPVPSPQFTTVVQHLMRLHDNIQDALPPDELKLLFMKISQTFKDVLLTHLRRLNISNDTGPQQWLVTQELTFYKISSEKLSVFKGWELDYEDLWTQLNSESDSNSSEQPEHGQ